MAQPRVRLGELLVEAQIITREQLDEALTLQKKDGRRLGTLLVEAGYVTETQATQILSQQLSVPWVSLYHIDFSRQLLNLVPREVAERNCLVPIFVRRVRGSGETLYLAMDNPDDEAARNEVAQYSGLPVRAMIAPPSDIRSAIRAYYGGEEGTASGDQASTVRLVPQDEEPTKKTERRAEGPQATAAAAPSPAEAATRPGIGPDRPQSQPPGRATSRPASVRPAAKPSQPPKVDTVPPDSGPIASRDISLPLPRKGGGKMITVTLLDGTKINLPAKRKKTEEAPVGGPAGDQEHLTARDLVAALRAVSHGADATEILGENARWEKLFAALLNVLLKKHLIADWEFVEEFRKI